MIKQIPGNIIRFLVLILLQVFVVNNIHLGGLITPYIYVLFILMLPFEIASWVLLILGFFTGITLDLFTNTIGLHTSATVFLAFMRPYALKLISPRDGYEPGTYPSVKAMGFEWFLKYVIMMVLVHHFFLFYSEVFDFGFFFSTFFRTFLSSIFSIFLIIISQYLF